MEIESSLRASDADREQVAERLRHAAAEGRLSADELDGRLGSLFAARTYGELDALLADLPAGRSLTNQRVRVGRWVAIIGALALVLVALGALAAARLHAAAEVAVGGRGPSRFPGPPLGQFRFRPPLADPSQALIVAVAMVGVFVVLLACGAFLWAFVRSRATSGA